MMQLVLIAYAVFLFFGVVCSFQSTLTTSSRITRVTKLHMGKAPKPSGFSTTMEGKTIILKKTKELLQKSSMILSIPFEGVSKENTDILRNMLPEGVQVMMVKNALMKKSIKDTEFEALADNLKQENIYLFFPEGLSKAGYETFRKWQKEIKRTDPEHEPRVLVTENQAFVGQKLDQVASLPSKLDLIAKIAMCIKATPTRLARTVKAIPDKLGKAVVGIKDQLEDSSKSTEELVSS